VRHEATERTLVTRACRGYQAPFLFNVQTQL
jgi:hypothetical protein